MYTFNCICICICSYACLVKVNNTAFCMQIKITF